MQHVSMKLSNVSMQLIVYSFVWVFRPARELFTYMETAPLLVKDCKFWPMLALMDIEQWGFFSVPHLLWHGTSVYNGHRRGPLTLAPVTDHLGVETSLPVLTTQVCRGCDSNTQTSKHKANVLNDCVTNMFVIWSQNISIQKYKTKT